MAARYRHEVGFLRLAGHARHHAFDAVAEREPRRRFGAELVAPREKRRLHRHQSHVAMAQALGDHPGDVGFADALGQGHGELHGDAGAVEFADQALALLLRLGVAQRRVAHLVAAVELQQHQHAIAQRRQPCGKTGLVEQQAVGGQVDLADAVLRAQPLQHLPELRVQAGFAAGDLHGVEPALERDQRRHVLPERLERQHAVALGIGVADAAGQVAGIGDLHQHRAGLVARLVGEIGDGGVGRRGGAALARSAAAAGELREVLARAVAVGLAPAVLARDAVVVRIVLDHRFGGAVLLAGLADPDPAVAIEHRGRHVRQAVGAEADGGLDQVLAGRQLEPRACLRLVERAQRTGHALEAIVEGLLRRAAAVELQRDVLKHRPALHA